MTPTPKNPDAERLARLDEFGDIVHRLEGWDRAYPTDIFREVTDAERDWLHETKPGLIDRISASMGRHMASRIREDIGKLRDLLAALEQPAQEGWVLVPVDPTPEMIEAGIMFGTSPNKACMIYQSMVNATPAATGKTEKESDRANP